MGDISKHVGTFISSPSYFYQYVKNIPILTMEEEYELFEDLNVNENMASAQKLVLHSLRYVHFIARKYDGYRLPYEDIVQESIIGLMKSIKSFDHKVGVRFMTYATHYIEGAIMEYVLANHNMIRISASNNCKKLFFNLRKTLADGHLISNDEARVASLKLGISEAEVHDFALRMNKSECSFECESNSLEQLDGEYHFSEILTDGITLEDKLIENEDSKVLSSISDALNDLSEREAKIINVRYLSETKMTFQELSKEYGVSIERIRQIETNAIKKIKNALTSTGVV